MAFPWHGLRTLLTGTRDAIFHVLVSLHSPFVDRDAIAVLLLLLLELPYNSLNCRITPNSPASAAGRDGKREPKGPFCSRRLLLQLEIVNWTAS